MANNNTKYFTELKNKANMQLFNIKNGASISTLDLNIIKVALENLVTYADKRLNPNPKTDKKTKDNDNVKGKDKNKK